MTPERIYGRPDDECLWDDPETVYETWADEWCEGASRVPFDIVEWSVLPNRSLLPSVDSVVEDLLQRVADDLPSGDAYHYWESAGNDPVVRSLLERALRRLSSVVGYSVADHEIRRLRVTWDDQGQPLLDGKPMYQSDKNP